MVACISRDVSSTMINLTFGDKKKKKNTFSKNEKLLNGTRRNFNLSILRHSWKIHKIGNLKKNHFTSTASNTSTYSFVTGRMPQSVAKNVCHVPFLASLRSIESRLFQRDKLAQRGGGRDRQWREENEWICDMNRFWIQKNRINKAKLFLLFFFPNINPRVNIFGIVTK